MEEKDKSRGFFYETLNKLREQKDREDGQEQEKRDRMTSAYTSLNNNIKSNRDIIRAIQDIKEYEEYQKETERKERRKELIEKKKLPDEVFLREDRLEKFNHKKEAFEKKSKLGKEKILDRIIQEEKNRMKHESKQSNLHWMDKNDKKNFRINKAHNRKLPRVKINKRPTTSGSAKSRTRDDFLTDIVERKLDLGDDSSEAEAEKKSDSAASDDDEFLLDHEYKGLWAIDFREKESDSKFKPPFISENEMRNAMDKLRTNIVRKQVAAGREFKGQAFRSQPEVITFKDFDVGKNYQKKVQLTNVSYSVNYCKFVEVSDNLRRFCYVEFDPPGSLSAGLTCWFKIKFTPLADRDIDGSVNFLTQTGPFEVPMSCRMKKCLVSLENERLDLGRICKGEKIRKSLLLKNEGFIPTDFTIGEVEELQAGNEQVIVTETDEPSEQKDETSNPELELGIEVMKTELAEISHIKCLKSSGHLAGYSECLIEFEFAPDEACVEVKDFAINFTQEKVERLIFTVCAESTELSIWLEKDSLDMQICTFGSYYQDSIIIYNQATNSMNISTDIPPLLEKTLHILPISALIQGQDKLALQLQFTPTLALLDEKYRQFYNPGTSQFEVHFNFCVKGLSLPLPFTLTACLTTAELSFNKTQINFGTCHMQESSVTKVELTNHSLLPQKMGFINTPQVVEIRPNDGFLTLLPKETCELTLVFSPDKIKLYDLSLTCKSQYDKDYVLSCTGKGVQSGMKLSHTRITFRDTTIDELGFATITISNPKISRISSARVRGVAPVNTNRIFQFEVPSTIPIKITPEIGNLPPGGTAKITVQFAPVITREEILELAREITKEETKSIEDDSGSRVSIVEKKGSSVGMLRKSSKLSDIIVPEEINEDTPAWREAKQKLIRAFQSKTDTVRIPCFVSIATQSPTFLPDETLHLDVLFTSIPPKLFLKDVQTKCIEFGGCLIGMKVIREVEIENTSDAEITFTVDPLDVQGPFEVLNALSPIGPGDSFGILIEFVPTTDEVFHEQCIVRYGGYHRLSFFLSAKGEKMELELLDLEDNPIGEEIDMGGVVVNEKVEFPLQINNKSVLPCEYICSLGGLSTAVNYTGISAFDIHLFQGEIPPTTKKEISVIFGPDRPSLLYEEEIHVKVNKNEKFFKFTVKGRGHDMNMHAHPEYIHPVDLLLPLAPERYADIIKIFLYTGETKTVQKVQKISNIKHRTTGFKGNGEFQFEFVEPDSAQKVFQIEPMKSTLEAGSTVEVKLTFDPSQLEPGTSTIVVYYKLTLKGDFVRHHRIVLRGRDAYHY